MKCMVTFLRNNKGNIALEFAIVVPFLFVLLAGILNFGLIIANQNQLNSIVSAGLLYAACQDRTSAEVETVMNNVTTLSPITNTATLFCQCLGGSAVSCSSTCPDGTTPMRYITAQSQSQVTLIVPDFIVSNPFVTTAKSTVRTK